MYIWECVCATKLKILTFCHLWRCISKRRFTHFAQSLSESTLTATAAAALRLINVLFMYMCTSCEEHAFSLNGPNPARCWKRFLWKLRSILTSRCLGFGTFVSFRPPVLSDPNGVLEDWDPVTTEAVRVWWNWSHRPETRWRLSDPRDVRPLIRLKDSLRATRSKREAKWSGAILGEAVVVLKTMFNWQTRKWPHILHTIRPTAVRDADARQDRWMRWLLTPDSDYFFHPRQEWHMVRSPLVPWPIFFELYRAQRWSSACLGCNKQSFEWPLPFCNLQSSLPIPLRPRAPAKHFSAQKTAAHWMLNHFWDPPLWKPRDVVLQPS